MKKVFVEYSQQEGNVMAKKSTATLLKEANLKIIDLEKKLADQTRYKEHAETLKCEYRMQLEDIHEFLDAVNGSVPRNSEEGLKKTALTRLTAWLVNNQRGI